MKPGESEHMKPCPRGATSSVPVFWRGDPLAGSGKCIWTGLTIPLLQCTRTSEVVRRRGDHPTKTGGRPNPKTGRRPSHVRRDNGTSLRQNRKQSVHLKRAALYNTLFRWDGLLHLPVMVCGKLLPVYETLVLKGYSPNSSEASFCVSLPVWLVQQGRQRGRCPQGLLTKTIVPQFSATNLFGGTRHGLCSRYYLG